MPKLQGTFKLRVKIDGREFEAEGRPDIVGRQFEAFRVMIQEIPPAVTVRFPSTALEDRRPGIEVRPSGMRDQGSPLSTLFQVAPQTRRLSLRQPPTGSFPEADAVLLLLFGHKRIREEEEVPVTVLTEALKQSGCPVKRLDRILTIYTKDHSVLRSGRGKGGKYRLTNLGLKKAEALVQELSARA